MRLTIITITKDNYQDLKLTLKSVRPLLNLPWCQQIVVDSSKQDTAKQNKLLCNTFGVDYHYHEPKGIYSAFNKGLAVAKGDWVWFLNSGDELLADFDLDLLETVLNKSDADMISFQVFMSKRGKTSPTPLRKLWPPLINWINHQGAFVRRSTILKIGGFDENFKIAGDAEMWLRFFNGQRSADIISIPIAKFVDGGISAKVSETAKEVLRAYAKNWKLILFGLSYPIGRTTRVILDYLVKTIGPRT